MDLICFSHLRWNFVFQRPQHLLTRFSKHQRVFYIEEPIYNSELTEYLIHPDKDHPNVSVIIPHISEGTPEETRTLLLKELIDKIILKEEIKNYICWYYSPMALAWTDHLSPQLIIYDCMDELSAFKFAPPELKSIERKLMSLADVVFTGGRSLYEAKKHLHQNIFCFPSSIDKAHFALARTVNHEPEDQQNIPHPRLGFFGVIDERMDIELVEKIAEQRPDWHIVLVGPVVKIDPSTLPQRENIHYLGSKSYNELPTYLGGWDIAFLPFAKNESTRFISPTKTPEYLAGGKPVISTSIADVVNPYGLNHLVEIADTADEFILAAEKILLNDQPEKRIEEADLFLRHNSWDETWKKMNIILKETLERKQKFLNPKKTAYV